MQNTACCLACTHVHFVIMRTFFAYSYVHCDPASNMLPYLPYANSALTVGWWRNRIATYQIIDELVICYAVLWPPNCHACMHAWQSEVVRTLTLIVPYKTLVIGFQLVISSLLFLTISQFCHWLAGFCITQNSHFHYKDQLHPVFFHSGPNGFYPITHMSDLLLQKRQYVGFDYLCTWFDPEKVQSTLSILYSNKNTTESIVRRRGATGQCLKIR